MEDFLRVGVITSTHGIKGEVKVFPTTDDVTRFESLEKCYIAYRRENIEVHPVSVKYFKNMVILKFKEYDDINDIEKFRQCDILINREDAVELLDGEFFICDVIGAKCYDQNDALLGEIYDYLDTAANGVFVIKDNAGKEILVPVVKEWVTDIDTENKIVRINMFDVMED